ncbi:MAG TPA: hypothetical protein VIM98_07100 [Dyella sp.]|uniref:hypothetical protein n=1 Tax=Dyella sp. TaxID=1869338 RepID=UPI002F91EF21
MGKSSFVSLMLAMVVAGGAVHAQADTQAQPQPQAKQSAVKPGDRNCIRDTGSLIKPKDGACLPVAGRSYGQEDLQRTGKTRLGPALQDLDSSVTVGGR